MHIAGGVIKRLFNLPMLSFMIFVDILLQKNCLTEEEEDGLF